MDLALVYPGFFSRILPEEVGIYASNITKTFMFTDGCDDMIPF